jgi:transposase InsO family protein
MEGTSSRMICLNGSNWLLWKGKMLDILYYKDMYAPIEGDTVKPKETSDAEWKKLNLQVVGLIRQWVDDKVYHHISDETNACELWKKLTARYERKTAVNKAFLIRQLVNLKFKEGGSVSNHLNDFQSIVNQLTTMKMNLDEELQALMLLSSLPDSWETLVVSLSNSTPDGKMTMEQVTNSMFNEETRRQAVGADNAQAFVTENRGRSKNRGFKSRDKSKGRSKSRGRSIERRKCYHCGKEGHMKRNCYAWKREQNKVDYTQRKDDEKNTTATCSGQDVVVLSYGAGDCLHIAGNDEEWVVDTAASYHATPNKEIFTSYKAGDFGMVRMGNTSNSKIVGVGNIRVQTNVGCTLILKDVRHIPDLRLNLISGNILDKEGYESYFGKGIWKLTKGSLVVAKGKSCCSLYKTHMKVHRDELFTVEDSSSPNLWHRRLGHMSEKGLQILAKKSLIPVDKGKALTSCEHCLFGKQHRVSFATSSQKKSTILERVYSDVCGPIEVPTLGGNRYFVTFIDDASRKVWVYLLKTKDQVFDIFQQFHAMVERETGKQLKCLRTDNGGEYTTKKFRSFCSEHGIRHEKTVPGTPQHNGIAERMNRTIVERVRCMLKMAGLHKSFWGEATLTACYLINRSPSVPLDFDIPERVWSGRDVSYSHLKVFGCKAFAHVPKENRLKLDDKTLPCIFLGYGNEEFGFRLWDPIKRKIVRSRDVVFYEDQFYGDADKPEKSKAVIEDIVDLSSSPSQHTPDLHNATPELTPSDEPELLDNEEDIEQGEHPHDQEDSRSQVRRSTREHRPSSKYPTSEYILLTEEGEPEVIDKKQIKLEKIHTEKNPSDMLTKVVPTGKLELCSQLTGLNFQ